MLDAAWFSARGGTSILERTSTTAASATTPERTGLLGLRRSWRGFLTPARVFAVCAAIADQTLAGTGPMFVDRSRAWKHESHLLSRVIVSARQVELFCKLVNAYHCQTRLFLILPMDAAAIRAQDRILDFGQPEILFFLTLSDRPPNINEMPARRRRQGPPSAF